MNFNIECIHYQDTERIGSIFEHLSFLRSEYPNFALWIQGKVLPGLESGNRQIYVATTPTNPSELAGILILKNELYEKKVCTLCVFPKYQKQHIGTKLLHLAIDILQVSHPLITVSSTYKNEYSSLFKKFGFSCFASYRNYYQANSIEYSYNSPIERNSLGDVVNG